VVTLELLEALGYRHHYPPDGKWRLFWGEVAAGYAHPVGR
jgi:hypothetical protein